jgi:hypothetical protein
MPQASNMKPQMTEATVTFENSILKCKRSYDTTSVNMQPMHLQSVSSCILIINWKEKKSVLQYGDPVAYRPLDAMFISIHF